MRRLAFIDTLRGFAALYVAIFHMTLLPRPELELPVWAGRIAKTGGTGVALFFMVSAFSLCLTMPQHEKDGTGLAGFYIRRLFRIAPLFYVMIAFTLLRDRYYFHTSHSFGEIFKNIFFVFNFDPGRQTGIVWASWTIGVEMIFYCLFPFLYRFANTLPKIFLALAALVVLSMGVKELILDTAVGDIVGRTFFDASVFRCLPIFLFGMIASTLFLRFIEPRRLPKSLGLVLIVGAVTSYLAMLPNGLVRNDYLHAAAYLALLLGFAIYPIRIFVNPVFCFLGARSYSLYLLHPPLIVFLFPVYPRIYALPVPDPVRFALSALLTLSLLIAASSLTYRFVEQPGMRLGKRVLAALALRRAPVAVPATDPVP